MNEKAKIGILVGLVVVGVLGFLFSNALGGGLKLPTSGSNESKGAVASEESAVRALTSDPFSHQRLIPANLNGQAAAAQPVGQPAIQPMNPGRPPRLPGNFDPNANPTISGPIGQAPGQAGNPPVEQQPEALKSPVNVQVKGILAGSSPMAYISVNGQPSISARVGAELTDGVTVTAISERSVTFSRGGKSTTVRTGQVETL